MDLGKCEKCLHSRVIMSENDRHATCTLPEKQAAECAFGKKSRFLEMKREYMDKKETEAYDRGYAQGLIMGRVDARVMKENADGCKGCAFEDTESWQLPCDRCKRNSKDYWRTKV